MSRIYGIDTGSLNNVDKIDNLDEIDLFFKIDKYINYILKLKDNGFDVTEEFYSLEYLVYKTSKFGVKFDQPSVGHFIIPNDSFKDWYLFYKNYFNKFPKEVFDKLMFARLNDENINSYLPKITWNEKLKNSEKIEIKFKRS